ncbi:MAG: hypothetical protein OXF62_08935 [Caldilineaceae bacterium]|nr:hypothetical protein [Caldilineaceae bacterium]MCY4090932.1 hypothetical protein [Caldilineaceae bacterium]MCY4116930.1 hypothetical protein [Caldilineaceae bacterium]
MDFGLSDSIGKSEEYFGKKVVYASLFVFGLALLMVAVEVVLDRTYTVYALFGISGQSPGLASGKELLYVIRTGVLVVCCAFYVYSSIEKTRIKRHLKEICDRLKSLDIDKD